MNRLQVRMIFWGALVSFAGLNSIVSAGDVLPKVKGVYFQNFSSEIVHVHMLYTFIDGDGYTYNTAIKQVGPGDFAWLDKGAANKTRTYYIIIHSKDLNKHVLWNHTVPGAIVNGGQVPLLKPFTSFKNKYVASMARARDFRALEAYFPRLGSVPATRIGPTGNFNLLTVTYKGNLNGNISIK